MTDFFGWRSGLASLILNWCLVLILPRLWWVNLFWYMRTPWIQFLRIRCWRRRCWFAKTFPDIPCVSQMLGGPSLRLGIPIERLSIPPGIGWGGKDTGWLVTWKCPLRTDSASWKSLESFIQLISFCNSCILPMSSKDSILIFDQFSPRNCVECWTLKSLQFFHFIEAFLMNFTKIPVLLQ